MTCWSFADGQQFIANCCQSKIWKEFSREAQACTLIYNACLKDDKKNKSWIIQGYVVCGNFSLFKQKSIFYSDFWNW